MAAIFYNPHVSTGHDSSGNHIFSVVFLMEQNVDVFYRVKNTNADPGTGVPIDSKYDIEFFFGTPSDPSKWHNISDLGARLPISIGGRPFELARFKRRINNLATAEYIVKVIDHPRISSFAEPLKSMDEDPTFLLHNGTLHKPKG